MFSLLWRNKLKTVLLVSGLAAGFIIVSSLLSARNIGYAAQNPIQVENSLPGAANWSTVNSVSNGVPASSEHGLEGYASEVSIQPGGILHLHASGTAGTNYRTEIYRLGWYGGTQARLIGCLPSCSTDKPISPQSVPSPDPVTGFLDAGWPVTDTYNLDNQAISGYYLAKLVATSGSLAGKYSNIPFIVKAPAGQNSSMLVQAAVNTWQAYNPWGGKSLYSFNSTNQVAADHVSFNRPYHPSNQIFGGGLNDDYEYSLVAFLEKEGYDVSYTTDLDTHLNPAELQNHKLDISNGHDEYWTKEMFDGFIAARDHGNNLAFMGANQAFWQIRYEDNYRTLVEYRDAVKDPVTDPSLDTVNFSQLNPPRPECILEGVQYFDGLTHSGDAPRNYTVTDASLSDSWYTGTGFQSGDQLGSAVGYEWNGVNSSCPGSTPVKVFFHYQNAAGTYSEKADITRYTASSGARVFATGSLDYITPLWGNPKFQQFVRNALDDLSQNAATVVEPAAPLNTFFPTISGTPQVGQSLTATTGSWSGNPTPTYAYQWQNCTSGVCSNISAATNSTYAPTSADVGKTIKVVVTATNSAGNAAASSSETAVVAAAPVVTTDLPLITGFTSVKDSTCSTCSTTWDGTTNTLTAQIAGGADTLDTAYGLKDFGGTSGWSGRTYARTILGFPAGQAPITQNIAVFQVYDAAGNIIYELFINGSDKTLSLYSRPGGLQTDRILATTGVVVPTGSTIRVEVSALANNSIVIRVNDVDKLTLAGLSGGTAGNARYLRAGIDHYDATTTNELMKFTHTNVGITTVGWLGTRTAVL